MLVTGVFLREFVPDGLAWAHIDIAGLVPHQRALRLHDQGQDGRARPRAAVLADIAEAS